MNINYGPVPTLDWIELKKLKIDDSYQRDTQSRRSQINISKIVDSFSWDKFSPISVSENTDGTFNIIDGQHRVEAIRQLGDIDKVPCWVIPGRLFLESSGLVIKLYHKLQCAKVPDSENHLAAAKDFIHRNELYKQAIEGFMAKLK